MGDALCFNLLGKLFIQFPTIDEKYIPLPEIDIFHIGTKIVKIRHCFGLSRPDPTSEKIWIRIRKKKLGKVGREIGMFFFPRNIYDPGRSSTKL